MGCFPTISADNSVEDACCGRVPYSKVRTDGLELALVTDGAYLCSIALHYGRPSIVVNFGSDKRQPCRKVNLMSSSPSFLDPIVLPLIVGEFVLDVACGYGRWGNLIYANFWEARLSAPPQVDGFDAFAPNVELCQGHHCYRKVWQHTLPHPIEGKWDTVLACEIIEHLPQSDIDRVFAVLEGAARRKSSFRHPIGHIIAEAGKPSWATTSMKPTSVTSPALSFAAAGIR